ncbi:uncharacterized protein LOC134176867 [Corticium candelabrum]|uniref:uncharacterized protein LOC134176867 n=1 Tax=Corticium candelabrum TaxID=121492 RepID=UPI002E26D8BA|nr:uncharacterized protein LOC134176867 [Corticium candelabrum]
MKGSHCQTKVLFTSLIFTVGVTTCCLIAYLGVSKSSYRIESARKYSERNKGAFSVGTDQRRCTTLWERFGCGSQYPILRCKPFPSTEKDRHYDAVVKTFNSLVHLNGCRHETCSLVGSSGILKNHARGKVIDKSKIVIRVNNQPITGFEKYVGTRPADIMIFNYQTDCFTNTSHPTLYIRSTNKPLREDAVIIKKCQANRFALLYSLSTYVQHQAQILLETYAVRYKVQRNVSGSKGNYFHATSGFKALIFSLMICRQVHLFGFGMEGAKTWHYYPPYRNYTPAHHEMSLEMKIIQDIAKTTYNSSIANFLDGGSSKLTVHH